YVVSASAFAPRAAYPLVNSSLGFSNVYRDVIPTLRIRRTATSQQLGGSPPAESACSASTAWPRVSTLTSCKPSSWADLASSQLSAGTRKTLAPASRAASILWVIPPIEPTLPSLSMVPVPATNLPSLRSPVVSLSTTASENISPAEGPPMFARLKSMANGAHGAFSTPTPRYP